MVQAEQRAADDAATPLCFPRRIKADVQRMVPRGDRQAENSVETRKSTPAAQSKPNPSSISSGDPERSARKCRSGQKCRSILVDAQGLDQDHTLAELKPEALDAKQLITSTLTECRAVQSQAVLSILGDLRGLIRTADLPWILPRGRRGAVTNASTIYRWITKGLRGHRLVVVRIAGQTYVHVDDLREFLGLSERRMSPGDSPSQSKVAPASSQHEATERRLKEAFGV